jgi:SPP1 family predicted phage head-tail adaptor
VIAAGKLTERVTIISPATARDAFGAEVLTWLDGPTVRAAHQERGGREPILADRPVMVVAHEFIIRKGVAVSQKYRLLWRGKTLEIDTVTPLHSGNDVLLRCVEVDTMGAVLGASGLDFSQLGASQYVALL